MSAFSKIQQESRRPAATLTVPLSAFSLAWEDRPDEPATVGLRPLSESDIVFCRGEAIKFALTVHPFDQQGVDDERLDVFNDALMRFAIARGTCDAKDATAPWYVWGRWGGDELVRDALTPEGVKLIWDALERTTIETSPTSALATDEEVAELVVKAPRALAEMPPWQAQRVRRLLRFCLEEMSAALGETLGED